MQKENHKKNLSCRKDVMRHLRIFVSDGMVNGRKEIRRSRIETLRDDKPLLTKGNGFTLIELLVVVLIIGILAAVAVPQYQKAVWRSRNTQLKSLLASLGKAQASYYLANNTYVNNFDELDIDLPFSKASKTCWFDLADGTDVVRRGKNFEILISPARQIFAVWTIGPYQCAGFVNNQEGTSLRCIEHAGYETNNFCTQLEKATFISGSDSGGVRYYTLP